MTNQKPRLLFLNPEDWYFWLHWRSIAHSAQAVGFDVSVATRVNKHGSQIEKAGLRLIPIRMERKSRNPLKELLAISELVSVFKRERPCIVNLCTIKPVLYGALAAKIVGIPCVVSSMTGLGYVFVAGGWRRSLMRSLICMAYRVVFGINASGIRVVFQNPDDRDNFVARKIIPAQRTVVILGVGVDPLQFIPRPEPHGIPIVMFAGRLIWDKGIGELVEAVKNLKKSGVRCRLVLVGVPDAGNPVSISENTLRSWQEEGLLEWWGLRDDMPEVLSQATVIVLPTKYGEGVPRILTEGAMLGRALVTTNMPGSREIVRHNENGLLVPPGDPNALAEAIDRLLRDHELRARMGSRGREIAMADFSSETVNQQTLEVYRDLLGTKYS